MCPNRSQEVGASPQSQLPNQRPTSQLDASFSLTNHSIGHWVPYLDLLNVCLICNLCLCRSLFHDGSPPSVLANQFSFLNIFSTIYRVILPKPKSDRGTVLFEILQWCRESLVSSRLLPHQAMESAPSSFNPFALPSRKAFNTCSCLPAWTAAPFCVCVHTDSWVILPLIWVINFYFFLETQLR